MSVYRVPQDVEAEDKLLGPFSFRQFIFLIIAIAAAGAAYALGTALLPLGIIPIPVMLLFGALALPLKKDQPMEVYLAAVISFMIKPKKRLWQPDGVEALVEVVAPRVEEKTYGNRYGQEEVQRRLSYLANLVDSHGWSIRGVGNPDSSSMRADLYNEAQTADDVLDETSQTAQNIGNMLAQADNNRRQEMIQRITQAQMPPLQPAISSQDEEVFVSPDLDASELHQTAPSTLNAAGDDIRLSINPYPTMHQSTLAPLGAENPSPKPQPQEKTSETAVSPAIIDLANTSDLSIETIQREAKRIKEKELEEEVVVSLR